MTEFQSDLSGTPTLPLYLLANPVTKYLAVHNTCFKVYVM